MYFDEVSLAVNTAPIAECCQNIYTPNMPPSLFFAKTIAVESAQLSLLPVPQLHRLLAVVA
jgi:hypothetical protein